MGSVGSAAGSAAGSRTEETYATATRRLPRRGTQAARRAAGEPSRTQRHVRRRSRRATWVGTAPVGGGRRRAGQVAGDDGRRRPTATRRGRPRCASERRSERRPDRRGPRRLAAAGEADDGVGGIQPRRCRRGHRAATSSAQRRPRSSGRAPTAVVLVSSWAHRASRHRQPRMQPLAKRPGSSGPATGRRVLNGPMSPRPLHVTFVCSGNICRSPMGHVILQQLVDRRRPRRPRPGQLERHGRLARRRARRPAHRRGARRARLRRVAAPRPRVRPRRVRRPRPRPRLRRGPRAPASGRRARRDDRGKIRLVREFDPRGRGRRARSRPATPGTASREHFARCFARGRGRLPWHPPRTTWTPLAEAGH